MGLWILFLLHLHLVVGVSLPAPFNVSIASFNMEHTLSFLPGPVTPADTHFRVQILNFRRKSSWRPVAGCLELTAGQTCNLTRACKDPLNQYRARVQAFTPSQESSWTLSGQFQPLTDTVLGPPTVSVSGCGNCLILQVSPPTARTIEQHKQLQDLYRGLLCQVRRTRDGAQFSLNLPYQEETLIDYLQPGVEYCVTVTVTTIFSPNSVSTKPHCAFTSPPPATSSVHLVLILLFAFCVLGLLLVGLVIHGGHLTSKIQGQDPPRTLALDLTAISYIPLQGQNTGSSQSVEQFIQASASEPYGDASADTFLALHDDIHPLSSSSATGEGECGPAAK